MLSQHSTLHTRLSALWKIVLPLLLGAAILYWMYRDTDFTAILHALHYEMNWTWMLLSFPFGIMAQVFRAWRWQQTLSPVGEHPRTSITIHSIFISYASSLIIPRVGEFARCAVLRRYDGVSFPRALGTVVTERAIDTLFVGVITGATLLLQMSIFGTFFRHTGTSLDSLLRSFSPTGYVVVVICIAAILLLLHLLLRRLSFYRRVKTTVAAIWQGVTSLRSVNHPWRYVMLTIAIWGSYFLHYYLTFFCFPFTSSLDLSCALVTFVVGTIAVIVPTPNGAGPWHFAVKTMLVLYGLTQAQALTFVLIVHTLQTLLVALLGVWAVMALLFTSVRTNNTQLS